MLSNCCPCLSPSCDKDNDGIKLLEKKAGCSKRKAKKVKKEYIKSDCIQETTGHQCDQVLLL